MLQKYKITYFDYGNIKSKIILTDEYNFLNDIVSKGIYCQLRDILKIEKLIDSTESNTLDYTTI